MSKLNWCLLTTLYKNHELPLDKIMEEPIMKRYSPKTVKRALKMYEDSDEVISGPDNNSVTHYLLSPTGTNTVESMTNRYVNDQEEYDDLELNGGDETLFKKILEIPDIYTRTCLVCDIVLRHNRRLSKPDFYF